MDVEFVTSAPGLASRPERVLPEFAFAGRSNCGKSSLINLFLNRRGMAKTSGKPGKTRLLNYFLVDNTYYLVDLPGYGFAKVSKDLRAAWVRLMRAYLFVADRPLAETIQGTVRIRIEPGRLKGVSVLEKTFQGVGTSEDAEDLAGRLEG